MLDTPSDQRRAAVGRRTILAFAGAGLLAGLSPGRSRAEGRQKPPEGLVPQLGIVRNATSEEACKQLDWRPRSADEAIIASGESLPGEHDDQKPHRIPQADDERLPWALRQL